MSTGTNDTVKIHWMFAVPTLISFSLMVVGMWWDSQPAAEDSWNRVMGTVVAIDQVRGGKGVIKDRPTVRYTVDGQEYLKVGGRHDKLPFSVGDETFVRYDPDDPSRSYLSRVDQGPVHSRATALGGIGMVFTLIFGFFWWWLWRSERKEKRAAARAKTSQ